MKQLFTSILLVVFFLNYSQTSIQNEDNHILETYKQKAQTLKKDNDSEVLSYEDTYIKLKELYLALKESESYQKSEDLMKDFNSKMNIFYRKELLELKKEGSVIDWVKANIESTSFKDIEEAEKQYEEITKADLEQYKENEEFYVYLLYVINTFGAKIYGEVILDYEYTNPNSTVNKFLIGDY